MLKMFKKRDDSTQNLYEKFAKMLHYTPHGYSAKGIIVLTTDPKLNIQLIELEKARRKENCKQYGKEAMYKIVELNELGIGRNELSSETELNSWLDNAIYFEEQVFFNGFSDWEKGGYTTIVIGKNIEELKRFIKPVIDRHIEESHISIAGGTSIFNDINVPYIEVEVSVNNEKINLKNNGFYNTLLKIKHAADSIIEDIDNYTQKNNKNI